MKQLYNFYQKKLRLLLGVCMILSVLPRMLGQTLFTESFNYKTATTSVPNWAAASSGNVIQVTSGNLSYPNTIGNMMGNKASLKTGSGQYIYRSFTSTAVNNSAFIYMSIVVNVKSATATGDYFFYLDGYMPIYVKSNGSGFSFGTKRTTAAGTIAYETAVRNFNTNYLLVVKYEPQTGANNDMVKLYVNPSLSSEPPTPDAVYSTGTEGDVTSMSTLYFLQNTNTPTLDFDNINVGTTWGSVTSAAYDYGDLPISYDTDRDGVFRPAVHGITTNLRLGSINPDVELAPYSVSSGENNTSGDNANGTADEDAIDPSSNPARKGLPYTLSIPVNNPGGATRYLYGWIDFNNDGKFQSTDEAAQISFNTTGSSTQTLTWTGTQTGKMLAGLSNLYLRLRLSDTSLSDDGDTTMDERSLGTGYTPDATDIYYKGEVEDYQIPVINTFDFGNAPDSYDMNKDGTAAANYKPARNLPTNNLSLGSTYTIESSKNPSDDVDGLTASQLNIRTNVINSYAVNVRNTTGSNATLYAWLDANNNGRFEAGEYTAVNVANNATTATISFSAAQVNLIPAATSKVYLRLRLIQPSVGASIADDNFTATTNTVVDERAIADGLSTGDYGIASYGEVEDYQLTVTRDFGDVPASYETVASVFTPASQTNDTAGTATFTMGTSIDYELTPASVTSPASNNGTNGDGADEDAVSTTQTVKSGLPFSITIPVSNKTASNKYAYAYAWIDLNGDGKFSGDEAGTASTTPYVAATNGTANITFTWSNTNASSSVITAGKTYVRFRLSDTSLTNGNYGSGTSTDLAKIDTRSYGAGYGDGEIEDYQFVVNNLYDNGDAPTSYDMNKDGTATTNYKPARNLPSTQLSLGSTYTVEAAPLSVAAGADNNGSNGDGISDDGLVASQLNIRTNIINSYTVNVRNTTGSNATLYAWLDANNNGRFESGEFTSVNVANNATTATISFSAAQVNLIPAATSKVYLRLRLIQPSAGASIADDNFTATTNTVVDERAIADGLSTGDYGIASYGEVEDYQLTVTRDYGDVPASYETVASVFTPASQTNDTAGTATFTMGSTIDYELTPASVTSPADNNGTNGDGADEDAVSTPQTVKSGLPFSITIPVNNKTTANRYAYAYAWIDLNGDGKFSGDEAGTASTTPYVAATNGTANITFTWSNTNASSSVITAGKTYVRFRLSDTSLTNGNYGSGTATDLAKIDTRSYGAGYGDGEIEDYQFVVTNLYDNGDVPVSYEQPVGNFVPARQAADDNLFIGGKPDEEILPNSVSNGADNNNPNGDGADEDGISNPSLLKVTPTQTFSLTVPVTNKTGSAKYLYGWLDANNNGIFEDTEAVVSSAINSSATSTSVTVTWPASVTAQIASDNVYVRFRISSAALNNNTGTTYDERAIADGTQTTGAYYQSTIGEVEDYRFGVNPVFDFGDAPNSYELNTNNDVIPARHIPGSTLYLGGTYDVESSKNAVAAGADNGGANGDGADEDGITGTLPQLNNNITTYSVNVNVYKTVAGTATLHGWIDMDGDGRFSSSEYTSATVTGTSGAQTVALTWPSPFYFDTGAARSYMRLRLTTAALADNTATSLVDERSIADGLSTGRYTTGSAYPNGEIEDYPVPLPAPVVVDPNLDSDGDGVKDVNDLDADNDGIPDSIEGPVSLNDSAFKLYNTPTVNVTGQARWNLYITGNAGTSVTYKPFNGSNITTTIPSAGILAINLTQSQTPDWPTNQVTNGKYVTVSSSAPISIVQEIYGDNYSADAAVVYPPSIWGNKYTISVYNNPSGFSRGIQIISSTDSNNVIVKNKAGNTVTTFTLNNGQNYIADFAAGTDISGYTVSSSKNVGIMVYNLCSNATAGACDNTLEYLLPDRLLGTKFFTRSPSNTGLMQITATQNNTVIKVDGSAVTVLVNAGDTYTYTQNIGSAQIIETNKPVQFIKVVPYDSDPSVTTVQDMNKATLGPAKMIVPSSMITSNNLTIFVKTAQTSKMLYNGNPITGWSAFSYDPNYSYTTLTQANGITAGSSVSITSDTGDVAFFTDWYGTGSSISDATPLSIGGVSLLSGSASANSFKDTDGDGIPDYLDLDSDNDGCLDAIEGGASITSSQLVNAGGTVTVGTGSTASNGNLCAGNSCVNSQGIPKFATPPSGYSNTTGQSVGTSIDPLIQDAVCLIPPFCYKPAATTGTTLDTKHGITALAKAGADNGNWPMVRKGAWTALESKEKGFVINRVATTAALSSITNPIEGMMVYDEEADCLKVYTTKEGDLSPAWHCMSTQTCPD